MRRPPWSTVAAAALCFFCLFHVSIASIGDHLPEFKECLTICQEANCETNLTPIPLHRRLLFWTCPSECDYACQHVITSTRLARSIPYRDPVVQYHGKWPFYRFLGIQEPFSVLFSLGNYLAHIWGLEQVRANIPASYALRKYYILFGLFGCVSWIASMVFHTRDFTITERIDYFGAGASVLYGMYFAVIRIFRLDDPTGQDYAMASTTRRSRSASGNNPSVRRDGPPPSFKQSLLRIWTIVCLLLYAMHVSYLTLWSWDYTYNMAANIAVGIVQNILWSGFSYVRYRRSGRFWQAWPGMIVAWIILVMSLEILDFVPWRLMIDAHSLWHLGTIVPTIWWYSFIVRDAQEDLQSMRLKA